MPRGVAPAVTGKTLYFWEAMVPQKGVSLAGRWVVSGPNRPGGYPSTEARWCAGFISAVGVCDWKRTKPTLCRHGYHKAGGQTGHNACSVPFTGAGPCRSPIWASGWPAFESRACENDSCWSHLALITGSGNLT